MFNKPAVLELFKTIKTTIHAKTLSNSNGFFYLPKIIYDDTLDFEKELHKYLTEYKQTNPNVSHIPWIGIVWKRGVLETDKETGTGNRALNIARKDLSNPNEPKGTIARMKQVLCPLDIRFYSNSFDYLESFEEYLITYFEPIFSFPVIFPNSIDSVITKVTDFFPVDFVKEEREKLGELCYLEIQCKIGYPVEVDNDVLSEDGAIKKPMVKNLILDIQVLNNKQFVDKKTEYGLI